MTIGFIGTGNMGGALMAAMAPHYDLCAYNRGREKLERICETTGARPMGSAREVAAAADLLVLAVKPYIIPDVLQELAGHVRPETLVVTVAVSLPLSLYEAALGSDKKIIRAMPNTPAAVNAGVTAYCCNGNCAAEDKAAFTAAFATAGITEELPEHLMGAVSALTGSSPAYICMLIEAMADAGVCQGIPRAQAIRMAAQAVGGTAKLVLESGKHPEQLKDEVCSPGGTTIRGVASLEQNGFRGAVIAALNATAEAARDKG